MNGTSTQSAYRSAYQDWDRAHADANRAMLAMALIPAAHPMYKALEKDHADALARRRDAGERIAALSKDIVARVKQTLASAGIDATPETTVASYH